MPPPEHRWEEMLRDVSSLAEKIKAAARGAGDVSGDELLVHATASARPVAAAKG